MNTIRPSRFILIGSFFVLLLPIVSYLMGVSRPECRYTLVKKDAGNYLNTLNVIKSLDKINGVIIGPSTSWAGISASELSQEISKLSGKKTSIINISSNWRGEDIYPILLSDLIKNKKIDFIIYPTINVDQKSGQPHKIGHYLSYIGDVGIPIKYPRSVSLALQNYGLLMLGSARQVYNIVRGCDFTATVNNSFNDLFVERSSGVEYKTYDTLPSKSLHAFEYTKNSDKFFVDDVKLEPLQEYSSELLRAIANANGISLFFVQLPTINGVDAIVLRKYYTEKMMDSEHLIGFSNIDIEESSQVKIQNFYYDNAHLNKNGSILVGRALAKLIYDSLKH